MSQISQHISILRRRIIALHRIRAVAFSVATTCLFVAACATIDYFVHWPIAARFIILFAAIIAAQKYLSIGFNPYGTRHQHKPASRFELKRSNQVFEECWRAPLILNPAQHKQTIHSPLAWLNAQHLRGKKFSQTNTFVVYQPSTPHAACL